MKTLSLLLLFSLLVSTDVSAGTSKRNCTSLPHPLSENIKIRQIKAYLDTLTYDEAVRTLWSEILKKDQSKTLTVPMLKYLEGIEPVAAKRGYYKVLWYSISNNGNMSLDDAIGKWPNGLKMQPTIFTLKDLCDAYYAADAK